MTVFEMHLFRNQNHSSTSNIIENLHGYVMKEE